MEHSIRKLRLGRETDKSFYYSKCYTGCINLLRCYQLTKSLRKEFVYVTLELNLGE